MNAGAKEHKQSSNAVYTRLKKICTHVQRNIPLKKRNSFRIQSRAEFFAAPSEPETIAALVSFCRSENIACNILGGGTNVLLSDEHVSGLVIHTGKLDRITVDGNRIFCGAGVPMGRLVKTAYRHKLSGLAFASGLPGSVGGAMYMNARCYGSEMADVVTAVKCLTPELTLTVLPRDRMDLAYKQTTFQRGYIILAVTFTLAAGDRNTIHREMKKNMRDRIRRQQFRYPSAGSIFLNDYSLGEPSGKIIDDLGLCGTRCGKAMVAPYHGNFIINTGNARARDVDELIGMVQRVVKEKRNIELHPEVQYMGDWSISTARDMK
ncbi:MAG: UDP-N-acetylmuramate dehydrogenase [Spirochaetes bacterium]|nr:UDP-N-acetylmuramate dehydrogenase [Spirochaetota bacterium]